MTLGDLIKEYRENHNISMDEFSKMCNLSKGYISMLENNINPRNNKPIAPTLPTVKKISSAMNVDVDSILKALDSNQEIKLEQESTKITDFKNSKITSLNNIYYIELKHFPLLGEIACGKPTYANEGRESYVMAGTDIKADFCLKAKGDSMINARILDGDIVFIRKQDIVDNGEIAAVVVNNESEATLKRFYYYAEKSMVILKAENPAFEDMIFTNEELNNFHILGKAVAFQSDVR